MKTREEVEKHDRRVLKHWQEKGGKCKIASRYLMETKKSGGDINKLGSVNNKLPIPENVAKGDYLFKPNVKPKGVFETFLDEHVQMSFKDGRLKVKRGFEDFKTKTKA